MQHRCPLWIVVVLGFAVLVLSIVRVPARDLGQWAESDPDVAAWYATLMQPDNPNISCCGEADAYFADGIEVVDGKVFAIITDNRPDEPLRRRHVPVGTKIEVPPHKLKHDRGNPVGHAVIFLNSILEPYCYVQGSLI